MKKMLAIIGAGGHGQQCAYVARTMKIWEEIVFFDDNIESDGVIDKLCNISKYLDKYDFFVGIGNNKVRSEIYKYLIESSAKIVSLQHPQSIVCDTSVISKGTVIMPGSIINNNVYIGECSIINTGAIIEHDCRIGQFVHIAPGVKIAGGVNINDYNFLGISTVVINNIDICAGNIIGASSLILKSIDKKGIYYGQPVRKKKGFDSSYHRSTY